MLCAAIMMDFIPDAQTLLIVVQGVDSGIPVISKQVSKQVVLTINNKNDFKQDINYKVKI